MTKDLGIDIKEMLIRQGWKIEESRELDAMRNERDNLQRLYISADNQCLQMMLQLGKADDRIEQRDEQIQQQDEQITSLTTKLEDAKRGEDEWRKKFYAERKETDLLRKQIDELIRPFPRHPNPVLSNSSTSSIESTCSLGQDCQPIKFLKGSKAIHKPSVQKLHKQ